MDIRIVELVAIFYGWKITRCDVVSAFPQAKEQELCYIEPPYEWREAHPEVEGDVVLRMDSPVWTQDGTT